MVIISETKPTVVQHKQIKTDFLGSVGNGRKLFNRKIEIGCLPVVDKGITLNITEFASADTLTGQFVPDSRHLTQTAVGINQHCFGGLEGFTCFKCVTEAKLIDTDKRTHGIVGIHLCAADKLTAPNKTHTVNSAVVFIGIMLGEADEGRMIVSACAIFHINQLRSAENGGAGRMALTRPATVKMHKVKISALGNVNTRAHNRIELDLGAAIFNTHTAGNGVVILKNRIRKENMQVFGCVHKLNLKGLNLVTVLTIGCRQTLKLFLAVINSVTDVSQLRTGRAIVKGTLQSRVSQINTAVGGILHSGNVG